MILDEFLHMRTTLAIDDDVFAAAKGLAARQHKSVGQAISVLARQALQPPTSSRSSCNTRNGVPLLPVCINATPVTPELMNQWRDELQQ